MKRRMLAAIALTLWALPAAAAASEPVTAAEVEGGPAAGFSLKAAIGPTFRRIYRTEMVAAEASFMFGGVRRLRADHGLGIYAAFGTLIGRTTSKLVTYSPRWGVTIERVLGDFRIGGTLWTSLLVFERASTDGTIGSLGIGGEAIMTYDVVPLADGGAIFLMASVGADFYDGTGDSTGTLFGGGLSVGYRM